MAESRRTGRHPTPPTRRAPTRTRRAKGAWFIGGAAILLAAGALLLAVGWSALGPGGRAGVLVVMTLVSVATTAWSGRRHLSTALESFGTIALTLLALTLFAAQAAGWLGPLRGPETMSVAGIVVAVGGLVAAVVVRRSCGLAFRAGEAFTVLGAAAFATGTVTFDFLPLEQALVLALLPAIVIAQASNVFRLPLAIGGSTAVSLAVWIALVWRGIDLGLQTPGWHKLWLQGHGWPLMVAALVAWLPAFWQVLALRAREVLVGIGAVPLFILVTLPGLRGTPERALVIGLAFLAGSTLVVRFLPAPVGPGWVIPTTVSMAAGAVLAIDYAGLGVERVVAAARYVYGGGTGGTLPTMLIPARVPDPAFNGLLTLVLLIAGWAVLGRLWRHAPRDLPGRPVAAVVAVMAWLGVITLDIPVWSWVVSGLLLGVGFAVDGIRSAATVSVSASAGLMLAAGVASVHAAPLNLPATATGALVFGIFAVADSRVQIRMPSATAASILLANAAWAAGWVGAGGAARPGTALFAICLLGALFVGLAGPADHSRTSASWEVAWYGVGIGSVAAWLFLGLAGIQAATTGTRAGWLALYLTAMGVSITGATLMTRRYRRGVLIGATFLVLAAWIAIFDLHG